jgi:Protein of unknown function (DUF1549)/Protein of unknown function (DUF1553)
MMASSRPNRAAENPAMRLRPTAALAAVLTFLCVAVNGQDKSSSPTSAGPLKPGAIAAQSKTINELMDKTWKANNVKPSGRATDYDFLRRAFLDLIGRIATPAEIKEFERDGKNRVKLVYKLLYDKHYAEEYAKNWSNIWTVWLVTRTGDPVYREQLRVWLEEHFAKDGSHKDMAEKLLTATGKTNDNGSVNYVLHNLGERVPPADRAKDGDFDMVPVTSRTTRLFLGLQTQCVQCHDHPFNPDWKQQHFWGVNVLFRQAERVGTPNMMRNNMGGTAVLELKDNRSANPEGLVAFEKRSGVVLYTKAVFLDGRKVDLEHDSRSRRQRLAELVTTHENFPKAFVNRMWGHLFGRGLNEQPVVDDFGEHNKVVHPELLDFLAKEFAAQTDGYEFNRYNAYDPKKLLYWICTSDVYGLSSVANATNDKPEHEVFFSRMLLKAMSPEQLFESLTTATNMGHTLEERKKQKEDWMRKLVQNFGDDEGNEVTFNGTVVQALLMMNGKEINDAIRNKDKGTVAEIVKKARTPQAAIREFYLAALNRPPAAYETDGIMKVASKYRDVRSYNFLYDVFWSLLNSNEFMLNH